jgi:hypothetical protein
VSRLVAGWLPPFAIVGHRGRVSHGSSGYHSGR